MPDTVIRRMGRRLCCLFLVAALAGAAAASAQEQDRTVRLKDGTVLRGTLLPSAEGVFRVKTRTLGEVRIDPSQILTIEGPVVTLDAADQAQRMERLKSTMLNSPEVMASVQKLAQDEEIAALMQDEELQAAIMSLDFDYLRRDERFQAFIAHPGVQEVVQKVKDKGADDE